MSVSFFRCCLFLLFVGNWTITSGADNIVSVSAPEGVAQGSTVSIEVSYLASTDRDILIIFQRNSSPWTKFGEERITVSAGSSTPYSCSY